MYIYFKATDSSDEDTNIKDLWNWWRNDKSVEVHLYVDMFNY